MGMYGRVAGLRPQSPAHPPDNRPIRAICRRHSLESLTRSLPEKVSMSVFQSEEFRFPFHAVVTGGFFCFIQRSSYDFLLFGDHPVVEFIEYPFKVIHEVH